MAYNKTSEERKWNYWKEQEEKKLRELGMDEEKIQKLRQMDWEDFLEERRYRERMEETMQEIDTGKPEDDEPFAMDVRELLDHVGDRGLYELLKDTEHQTLEILLLSTWGYSGREIAKIHPNMVVKIPMTVEGLKAVKVLSSEGIKTNVTLIFSANQAILAANAGATYVSPFLGRLDDISQPGIELIRQISEIFDIYGYDTEIIAASIRNPIHVTDCALAGADIATIPYKVIEQMTKHPLTDQGIEKFQADYRAVFGD